PSQVLAMQKSRTIQVQIGQEVKNGEPTVRPRERSVTGYSLKIIERIRSAVAKTVERISTRKK
ncbi:MAG TPA: hypothetical protein VEG44_05955, partial [Candidatus Acidoferrales bacterium]|nr:hypothetical protein [Candidatus Acidoferrales bacterium]